MVLHTREQLHHPQVFLLVAISLAMDQLWFRPPEAGKSEALVHLGRTLEEVPCLKDHIVGLGCMDCNMRKDFGSLGRIVLVAVCLGATGHR